MKRFAAALQNDVRLQWRYGFFLAGGFVGAFFIVLLLPLDTSAMGSLAPAFVLTNLTITTFYFVAGMVLFEKGEGTLEALVATPLRAREYLLARGLTLGALGIVETFAILAFAFDGEYRLGPLLLSAIFTAGFYTFIGFALVARYDSISDYLMPSTLYVAILQLPLLDHFGFVESGLFRIWPTQAFLELARAGVEPISTGDRSYGLAYGGAATAAAFALAHRSFHRFVTRRSGEPR